MGTEKFSFFLPPINNTSPDRSLSLEEVWKYISGREILEVRRRNLKTGGYLPLGSLQSVTDVVRSMSPEVYSNREQGKIQYLPLVTFGGVFSQRNGESLQETSGYICLDIDHISSLGYSLEEVKDRISRDREIGVRLVFTSPSGDGIKIVCKTSGEVKDSDTYREVFTLLNSFVSRKYGIPVGSIGLDKGISDITRGCLLCYDPGAVLQIWEDTFNPETHPLPVEERPRPQREKRDPSLLSTEYDISRKWEEYIQEYLIPAIFERLDSIFPEMDFHFRGSTWESPYKLDGSNPKIPRRDKSVVTAKGKGVILEQGGDSLWIIDYFMDRRGLSYTDARKELSRLCGLEDMDRRLSWETAQQKEKEKVSYMERNTAKQEETSVPVSSPEDKFREYLEIQDYKREFSRERGGIKTGYLFKNSQGEEEYLTLYSETLTFICGQSSHGKTRFLENLALQTAKRDGKGVVLFFTFEESFRSIFTHLANIQVGIETLSAYGTKNQEVLREYFHTGKLSKATKENRSKALPSLSVFENLYRSGKIRLYYTPDQDSHFICELIRYLSSQMKIDAVFMDYIQAVHLGGFKGERREELRLICEELKQTSVELRIPFVLSAQLNRETPNPTYMSGDNIAESADITRFSDTILCLWNSSFVNDVKDKERYLSSRDYNLLQSRGFTLGQEGKLYCILTKNREGTPYLDAVLDFTGKTGEIHINGNSRQGTPESIPLEYD